MSNDRIRVGILGYGKMGQTRAEAIEAIGEGHGIQKVFDVNYDHKPEYQTAESIDEIVEDKTINTVCVCLPNFMNKDVTIRSMLAGKDVFCEKPPAFTSEDLREIKKVEQETGKTLMYGFNHRHHFAVQKMRELINNGSHGRILWMRGRYGKSVDGDYLKSWRANKELAGGGILLDQGIHMLDLMLFLSQGNFDEVHALVSNLYWKTPGIEDNVFAIMRNRQTGVSASLHSTMTQWRHLFSLEIFLERGYMVLNGLKTSSGTYGEESLTVARNRSKAPAATWEDEERFVYKIDRSWELEMQMFYDAVKNRTQPELGTSDQALDVMQLIERIYESERHEAGELHEDLQSS